MELTQWAIFCVRRDVENAKYIQDKFYDISQQQKLGVYVDYGRIISLDDRATVNSFKEAIEKFYCDEIAPQNQGKKQYGAKKQVNKDHKDLSKGYVFLVIMPDSIRQEMFYTTIKSKINSDTPVISQFVASKTIAKDNDRIFINILR